MESQYNPTRKGRTACRERREEQGVGNGTPQRMFYTFHHGHVRKKQPETKSVSLSFRTGC